MAKDNQTIYIIIGLVAFMLIWQSNVFFVLEPSPQGFIQYTGIPICSGSTCSWFTEQQLASDTVQINTGKNVFRFESETESIQEKKVCRTLTEKPCSTSEMGSGVPTYIDEDGCQHWDYMSRSIRNFGYFRNPCGEPAGNFPSDCFVEGSGGSCSTGDKFGGQFCGVCWNGFGAVEDFGGIYTSTTAPDGTINRGCYQEINVYKNNILIDTLYSESSLGEETKTYYDNEISGSGVRVDMQSSWFHASTCSAYQNEYALFFPEDSIIMNTSSTKEEYLEGEDIKIDVRVLNNLELTIGGTLEVEYETPTILGTKTSRSTQEVIINSGENNFQYTIPTTEPVRILNIRPRMTVYYPTTDINGVNYNFGTGEVVNINSESEFDIGSIQGEWAEVRIKSEAESLRGEIDLLEGDIDDLQRLLNEKAQILNNLELTLQEQLDIIDAYELLIDEKAFLVSQLELNLGEQAQLIVLLTSVSEEQAILIDALELSIQQQAQIISQMQLTNQEQAVIISNLELSIQDQANLINSLNLNIQGKAIIISNLRLNIQDQIDLISQMQLTSQDQINLISNLELSIQDQAEIISNLELSIQQQAQIIDNLELNLAQKVILISQLELTNQEQMDLVSEMELSFIEQQNILDALNLLLSDDAQQIIDLQLTISQQANYIINLNLNIQQQAIIISQLELSNQEMGELVNKLDLTIQQQAELINDLGLIIEDDAQIILQLNLNIQQQAELISQLELSNQEVSQLIIELDLTIQQQAQIIDNLEITVVEKGKIIAGLRLTLEEEAEIINQLNLTIAEQIDLIDELGLSFEEEQILVNLLRLTIQEQQAILNERKGDWWENVIFNIEGFEIKVWMLLATIGGILLLREFVK